eukprot:symbB.v1.2.021699.t1/scaffold1891.1/size97027/4
MMALRSRGSGKDRGKDPESPNAQGKSGSMFSSLRRASLSVSWCFRCRCRSLAFTNLLRSIGTSFSRRGSSVEILPPVDKRRSTRSVRLKGSSSQRGSISPKKAESVLMQPHLEHTSLVLQQAVYRRTDRMKNLSSTWLAGGEKGELPEESSDDEFLEQSKNKRKKGKAEVSETEIADFITGLRRNMKKPETQATACEELSQRLAGRKQEGIESIVVEEAANAALEAAQEHPDDAQLHGAVCPLLADLMTFSKASGSLPTPIAAAGAALTLQSYIRFHDKLEAEERLLQVEQVFKRIGKELPVEDQLQIMNSVGDDLPSFCAKMYKKAAGKKFQQACSCNGANTAFGHLAWLRGHKLGADLMPTWQVQKLAVEEKKKTFVAKGPPRVGGDVCQKEWCYKGSFVNEVRFLAESQKMHLCWVNMDAARKLFKKDPSFEEANVFFCLWTVPADLDGFQALVHHVVAVATDDKRYLWSYSFVQFLTIVIEGYPYGQAHLSPEDFWQKYPKAQFPVPGHYQKPPKSEAMTMPVPVIVSRNLRPTPTLFRHSLLATGDRDPPAPPPLPDRLPRPIPYEITEPWMCIFASDMEKRDLGKLLDIQRSQLALSQPAEAHHVADDDEMEADEQPEESEIDDDEEVEPDSRQRSRQVPAEPSKDPEGNEREMDEQGDDEEPEDDEEREDGGDFDEDDDGFGEEAEEEAKEEQAEDLAVAPTRDEGLENESEFGEAQQDPHVTQVGTRQSARSARSSLAEDSEPRRASRRQSKD